MKKDIQKEIREQVNSDSLTEENAKKLFHSSFWFSFFWFLFLAIMLIFSAILSDKMNRFAHIIGSVFNYSSDISFIIYYTFLSCGLVFYGFQAIFTLVQKRFNKTWYKPVYKVFYYGDLPSFVVRIFAILIFILTYVVTPCNVSGSSMSDTLSNGDKVILWSLFYTPKDNDIIVFDATEATSNEAFYIKRCKAIDGDVVRYDSSTEILYVNDVDVYNGAYTVTPQQYLVMYNSVMREQNAAAYTLSNMEYSFTVKGGKVLVLGDNYKNSLDSRYFGLIDKSTVYGQAVLRILPINHFTGLIGK